MLVQRVLILLWKYLLVKEEDLFYWWKVSKFLLTALFANARRDDASKFSGWKYGHFETPTTKTDSLTFLENKRLFARTTYIRLLIYLKDIYGQKMKEMDFSTLATQWSIFPVDRRCKFCIYIYTPLLNSIPLLYTVEVACRKNIILRQIKQRNTNLLAAEFAWFDHKFRPRLRRPYFNSFARDTQSILVLAGMSSAYLISGSIPGTNPEVSACPTWHEHRYKTSTRAPGWAFPVSFSVTFSSQIALGFILCAARGSVVLLHTARVFDYFVVTEIAFMDNQAQITETTIRLYSSMQCRRFLWARNLLAKVPCWNFPKWGGDGASQREQGGGEEREEKTLWKWETTPN